MSHDSQSPIISLDLFIKNPHKAAVQSTTTPKLDTRQQSHWKHLITHLVFGALCSHWKPYWKPPAVSCYTVSHGGIQLSAVVESTGAEQSGALPGAGSSQRQSRAHIATVRSADWMRAVLTLTPRSACSLTGLPVYLAALSCFLCSS